MFGFAKKPSAEALASELNDIALKTTHELAEYFAVVKPTELEKKRIIASMVLMPLILSKHISSYATSLKVKTKLEAAHEIYLNNFHSPHEIVNFCDYIVWNTEKEAIAHTLREEYLQPVTAIALTTYKGKQSLLFRSLAAVRTTTIATDVKMAMLNSEPADDKQLVEATAYNFGLSFTKQVLDINWANELNLDKVTASSMLAGAMIFKNYTAVIRVHQKA